MQFSPRMAKKHAGVAFNHGFATPLAEHCDQRMLYVIDRPLMHSVASQQLKIYQDSPPS